MIIDKTTNLKNYSSLVKNLDRALNSSRAITI